MALTGWAYSAIYTIDTSVIDSDQANYIAQLYISDNCGKTGHDLSDFFSKLGSNYKKIAFEFNDTGTECYAECAQWDATAKKALYNVKVPNIYASTTIIIKVYYDPSHADNTTYIGDIGSTVGETVYDTNFKIAHQMANDPSGTPPQMIDSTSNSLDGTTYGSMTSDDLINAVYGGKGLDLDGSGDRVVIPSFSTANITIEILVRIDYLPGDGARQRLITKWTGGGTIVDGSWIIDLANTSGVYSFRFLVRVSGSTIIASYNFTPTVGQYYYIVATGDGTNFKLYKAGVQVASVSGASIQTLTQPITIAGTDPLDTTYTFDGVNSLTRISTTDRGADWIKVSYYSLVDNLFTVSGTSVKTALYQLYGAGPTGDAGIVKIWGLMHDPATLGLYKLWHIFDGPVSNSIIKLWGFAVESVLNKNYSNAAVAIISLIKRYSDAAYPKAGITIRYDDALAIEFALSKIYHLMYSSSSGLSQPYAITEAEVKAALDQLYDLALYGEPINAALSQVYGIIGAYSNITNFNNLSVLASGIAVYPDDIVTTEDLDQYCIRAEMVFKSQADYAVIQKNGTVVFNNGTTEYEFFAAEKRRSRSRNGLNGVSNDYVVVCLSWAASLDHPYSLPLSKSWDSAELASNIVQELADDITVDWQINDWTIPAGTLFANDETPIQIIRKIIRDRGVVQDNPNGKTISIVKEYAISPTKWAESSPVYTLSDLDDIETISEYEDERSGVNKIIVSNQLTSDKRLYPREEQVNSSTRLVKGYRIPWASTFTIEHSGGSWVSIVDNGIITEQITDEFIEFVDGIGRAGQPIYNQPAVKWMESGLGSLTYAEDGTLKAEISGNSLAEVSYLTKYRSWTVKDNRNEKVQIWLRATEND